MTNISDYAFQSCSSLTSITIPDSVTSIGIYAFYGCRSLTSITIPNSVIRIGTYAFRYCSQVPTLSGTAVFRSTSSSKKIVVPDSLYDEWITATNWSSTTNNIVTSIIKASDYEASL